MREKMYPEPQPVSAYLCRELECSCGRVHYADIAAVEIGAGAIRTLPEYTKKWGYACPYIVCDDITYKIAGAQCENLLSQVGVYAKLHIIKRLGFDEATLGELLIDMPADCDVIIAVGTGSISDIIRYMSFKLRLPCFTVATGAPMDGFAAGIGVMNVDGLKTTMPAHSTKLIIGDTDILRTAPYRMTAAGFGDLIGKLSCLNDWELARLVTGEHFCGNIAALVKKCVDDILQCADGLKRGEPEVLGRVMEGLVLSGTAISLYGDSRPASGAEHHMSHYWETVFEQRGVRAAMHGEQVAVGTVLILMFCEELARAEIDFDLARAAARSYDRAAWEAEIRRAYGAAADGVIAIEDSACKNDTAGRLRRIDAAQEKLPLIREKLNALPGAEHLAKLLRTVGCPCAPAQIGVDEATLKDTFMYCKEIRPRYTVLQLAYDLEVLDSVSDRVIERIKRDSA